MAVILVFEIAKLLNEPLNAVVIILSETTFHQGVDQKHFDAVTLACVAEHFKQAISLGSPDTFKNPKLVLAPIHYCAVIL